MPSLIATALRMLLLVFGVWACSTAVIMIKSCTVDPVSLSAFRLLIAATLLAPVFLRDWRRHAAVFTRRDLRRALLPGVLLGLHFISWNIGARRTTAANASLVVNLVPLAMPFLLALLLKERLNRLELIATVISLCGLAILAVADFNTSPAYLVGDAVCLGSMLLFALYLAMARVNRHLPSVWLYVVPLYFTAGVFCLLTAFIIAEPVRAYSRTDVLMVLGLGMIPTIMGHSILNYSLKRLRGQVVSIVNMFQFVFAGVMAYFVFREVPATSFYLASAVLVAAVWMAIMAQAREPARVELQTASSNE
jgi:drug/metabolite transporter (DMT)-like permease